MTKGIKTLIKLKKRDIDDLKKRQAVLLEMKDYLIDKSKSLQEQLHEEIRLAGELATLGNFFADFSEHIKKQQQSLMKQVAELDIKINILTDKISILFSDMKKFEISLEIKAQKALKLKKRKEQNQMDEIAARKKS